jgi:hypothetical protein
MVRGQRITLPILEAASITMSTVPRILLSDFNVAHYFDYTSAKPTFGGCVHRFVVVKTDQLLLSPDAFSDLLHVFVHPEIIK